MPYVRIQSNVPVDEATGNSLLTRISSLTASELGKPETYVMVALDPTLPMLFAGTDAPLAYLEVKSIGLPQDKTAGLSDVLSSTLEEILHIPRDRVYIEFADTPRSMWGWNGGTF